MIGRVCGRILLKFWRENDPPEHDIRIFFYKKKIARFNCRNEQLRYDENKTIK